MTPPKSPINIREIARLCGVSSATVSRVLNDKPDVSPEVRSKVAQVVREHNFVPRLTASRNNIIGVTVEHRHAFHSPYLVSLLDPLEDTAFDLGYDLLILRNEWLRQVTGGLDLVLKRKMLSGLVVLLSTPQDTFSSELAEIGFPHIVVNNRPGQGVSYIDEDSHTGAFEATRHLLSLGHRRIAMINHVPHMFVHRERLMGYSAALSGSGIEPDPAWVVEPATKDPFELARECVQTLLSRDPDLTALLAQADYVDGSLQALKNFGRRVPDDFSVIAFDESPGMAYSTPSITCVTQNAQYMGQFALQEVVRQIEHPETRGNCIQKVVPTQLVIRGSTGPAPVLELVEPLGA